MLNINNKEGYYLSFKSLKKHIHYTVCPLFFSSCYLHTESYLSVSLQFLKQQNSESLTMQNPQIASFPNLFLYFVKEILSFWKGKKDLVKDHMHPQNCKQISKQMPVQYHSAGSYLLQLPCPLKYLNSQLTS